MSRHLSAFRIIVAALLTCAAMLAAEGSPPKPVKKKPSTKPAYSISVRDLGYREPLFERIVTGYVPVSLNFLTPDRLLFTFNARELLAHETERCDGPYDDDQIVHAALLSLPDGKAVEETRWQLHDHNRYIWPVRDGILLRRCHRFDLLHDSLAGHDLLDFSARPMLVQTSPDGRVIVVETQHEKHTPEEHKRLIDQAILGNGVVPAEDIDVNVISLDTKTPIARALEHAPIYVPVVHDGFYNSIAAPHNHWLITFQPYNGKVAQIAKVESTCAPPMFPIADDALLIVTCVSVLNYHVLIAINKQGKELWRDEWLNNLSRPLFAFPADNRRFAVATVHTVSNIKGFGTVDDTSSHNEDITVYSTYKGEPLLTVSISPPYANGQNFALSPDGSQLAVINHSAIEVYNVPDKQ